MWKEYSTFIIIGSVLLILLILSLIWTIFGNKTMRREWHGLSRELGLQFFWPTGFWDILSGKMPSLSGKIGAFDFYCAMQKRNHGREQVVYTHISFAIKNVGTQKTVSVYLEDVFAKLGKAIGGQDVQFGHEAFDDAFMIKSNDEGFALKVLNEAIRMIVLNRLDLQGELIIEDDQLIYEEVWTVKYEDDAEKLKHMINVLWDIAKEINKL